MKRPVTLAALLLILAGLLLSGITDTSASIGDSSIPDDEVASGTGEASNSSGSDTITIRTYAVADEDANQGI